MHIGIASSATMENRGSDSNKDISIRYNLNRLFASGVQRRRRRQQQCLSCWWHRVNKLTIVYAQENSSVKCNETNAWMSDWMSDWMNGTALDMWAIFAITLACQLFEYVRAWTRSHYFQVQLTKRIVAFWLIAHHTQMHAMKKFKTNGTTERLHQYFWVFYFSSYM